jgi:hypothetical protein
VQPGIRHIRAAAAAACASVVLASFPLRTETAQPARPVLPGALETYVNQVIKPTAEQRTALAAGGPITKLLEVDRSKEVAVFGIIWINASMHAYVTALTDIENFERGGGFKVTKRISTPPNVNDFAALHLPQEDIDDLRTCTVGDCNVKTSEQALKRFQTEIDWKSPKAKNAVDALMRDLAVRYATGYLEGGNQRLAVYRDQSRPTFVAQELRDMIDRMPELTTYLPQLRQYLLEFPRQTLPNATSFLYWQETEFGLKPTLRISHVVISERNTDTIVASKMLFATHYFWTGLELRVLAPDPSRGSGFWLATVSRSRSDGLSGFTGAIIRRRVESETEDGARAGLVATKQTLEQRAAR